MKLGIVAGPRVSICYEMIEKELSIFAEPRDLALLGVKGLR